MAYDMFGVCSTVKGGGSKDATYKDAIELLSWTTGVFNSGSSGIGGGGGVGKASAGLLNISINECDACQTLSGMTHDVKPIPEFKIVMRKAGGKKPLEFVKITFTKLKVESHSMASGGGPQSFDLSYKSLKYDYEGQDEKGGSLGVTSKGWDFDAHKEL